jgi:hypothetical protein
MISDVLIHSIQIGKYLSVFNKILGKVTKSFLCFCNAILHNHIFLYSVWLEFLENFTYFWISYRKVSFGMLYHILKMLNTMSKLHQFFAL